MYPFRSLLLDLLPLIQNPSYDLQAFLDQHDLSELPEGEEPWEIPEPVFLLPSPVVNFVQPPFPQEHPQGSYKSLYRLQ